MFVFNICMDQVRELFGYVWSSKRRIDILSALEEEALRPFEIARVTSYKAPNVSITLIQLKDKGLVECLTPDKQSWRVYGLTELGREVLKYKY